MSEREKELTSIGIVYRGQWRDTQVAVKQIRAEFVTQRQLKDFLHEVRKRREGKLRGDRCLSCKV